MQVKHRLADVDYLASADYADKKDRLDIYAPSSPKMVPVIVSIHGAVPRPAFSTSIGRVWRPIVPRTRGERM